MSGHSKWSTIKHKKAATDKKRADVFAKIAKSITVAARHGGGDPEMNIVLRGEIEKAKSVNMPKQKIEQAILRGTGDSKEENTLEELLIEAYGPGNVAMLIEAVTDNRNRTTSELRHAVSQYEGKMAGEGSVKWMFSHFGFIEIKAESIRNKEDFEYFSIENNAEDIIWYEDSVVVYTNVNALHDTLKSFQDAGYTEKDAGLEWVAKNRINIEEKDLKKLNGLFETLSEHEDVQEVYSNLKLDSLLAD
ncbi:MAG: YebC/PmpR family DNA-binding transcriptional regulator [Candidatus Spechtbacterales bacterium]